MARSAAERAERRRGAVRRRVSPDRPTKTLLAPGPSSEEPRDAARRESELLWRGRFRKLVAMAVSRFRIPPEIACELAHDVFVRFLSGRYEVRNPEAWLAVAMLNASKAHLGSAAQRYFVDSPSSADRLASDPTAEIERGVLVRQAVGRLDERTRMILRLHYLDGLSATELARLFGTTPRYAERLIQRCLARARRAAGGG